MLWHGRETVPRHVVTTLWRGRETVPQQRYHIIFLPVENGLI
jgi:hypothetical protein